MKKFACFGSLLICLNSFAQLKPEDVKTFTLKNNMKFLVVEDSSIPNANMYLFYRVGSRNEHQGITGLSHFFEHMMFNGAKKYGPKMFDKTMEFYGGQNNAYTTSNVTVYTNWFPSSSMETIFDLEADRISSLTIDPKIVESERGVVISERSTSLENSPWEELEQTAVGAAFLQHPYHWPVIGYLDDMKNWKQEDLERYFKTYYAPNNCLVVVSGNVKLAQVQTLAQQYFEPIAAQPDPPKINITEPIQTGERRLQVERDVPSPYLLMMYKIPESKHEDNYALTLLSDLLTGGKSSKLYSELVDKKQISDEVSSYVGDNFDPYVFPIYTVVNEKSNETIVENAITAIIEQIKQNGVSARDLQKVKNQRLVSLYKQIETIDGKSNNLGTYEVFYGSYQKLFDAPNAFNKVTNEDIKRVAKKYFVKKARTIAVLKANTN
jgi:zinc protease